MMTPDFRDFSGGIGTMEIIHSAKGTTWKKHKYIKKEGKKYVYKKEKDSKEASKKVDNALYYKTMNTAQDVPQYVADYLYDQAVEKYGKTNLRKITIKQKYRGEGVTIGDSLFLVTIQIKGEPRPKSFTIKKSRVPKPKTEYGSLKEAMEGVKDTVDKMVRYQTMQENKYKMRNAADKLKTASKNTTPAKKSSSNKTNYKVTANKSPKDLRGQQNKQSSKAKRR